MPFVRLPQFRFAFCSRQFAIFLALASGEGAFGADAKPANPAPPASATAPEETLYIDEYRIEGAEKLSQEEVEAAVYPFLGPGRTNADVEQARAALEKAYFSKGYQTVSVEVPDQKIRGGVVILHAVEKKVGRLRVRGSRYFSLSDIKRRMPSLKEGTVPNFNDVTRELVALSSHPDRHISPSMQAGVEPGTIDVDLNVKDTLPLHGSLELNNRYSADTTELRVNGGISYNNLWQLGHGLGVNFQVAPQRTSDAKVFSGYYLFRFPDLPNFTLTLQGTKQDSNVSTLGGVAVAGRGEILGVRGTFTLPNLTDFYHALTVGFDYKHFDENIVLGLSETATPITYYPLSLAYNATWIGPGRVTELNADVNLHFRGAGGTPQEFEAKRYNARGNYIFLRADLAHTQDLPGGFQLYVKGQGQLASQPLLNSEQFAGGGLGTVRGYLESTALGDNGVFGTVELRSPSLLGEKTGEWRIYGFLDVGFLTLNDPLPEQESRFELASWGIGSQLRVFDFLNGSVDAGFPLARRSDPDTEDLLVTFRVWADF